MNTLLTLTVMAVIQLDDTFKPNNLPGSVPVQDALDPSHPESAATQTIIVYVGSLLSKVLVFAGALAVIFLVVAGANYILAFGKDERIERGKRAMFWAIMGLIIIMASYAMVQAILQVVYQADF